MKRALAACAVAVLVAVTGCGSAARSSTSADPASIAPAGTLAYASFTLAPQGSEKASFDAAFGKLVGSDPELKLGDAFTNAVSTSGNLSYLDDVKPWLGNSIAVAVTGVGEHKCDFALLMPSTDDGKAQGAIDKDLAGTHTQDVSYRGVDYKLQDDGTANGIVSGFVVAGTEPAFKAVVDAAKDGQSLASSDQWQQTVGNRADGKVGLVYVDAKGLLQSLAAQLPGVKRVAAPLLLGMLDLHPLVATLDAQPDALVVDVSSPGTKPDSRGPAAAASPLIDSFPANSWLAAAVPDVGQALGKVAGMIQANPLLGAEVQRVMAGVKANTGIDLQKDVIDAVGDVGVFVQGTTPANVRGTLVVQPTQPGALSNAMKRLPAVIESQTAGRARVTPRARGFDVTGPRGRHRLSVRTGVNAAARLGDTPLFKKAAAAIGQRPTLLVDFGKALQLAAQAPKHRSDEHFKAALPRLQHIEYVAAGARRDAGLDVVRGVIGLR